LEGLFVVAFCALEGKNDLGKIKVTCYLEIFFLGRSFLLKIECFKIFGTKIYLKVFEVIFQNA
jgi:hypothetical protein